MRAAQERNIIRWIHLIANVPIIGYVYGAVADIPQAAFAVKAVIVPCGGAYGLLDVERPLGKKSLD